METVIGLFKLLLLLISKAQHIQPISTIRHTFPGIPLFLLHPYIRQPTYILLITPKQVIIIIITSITVILITWINITLIIWIYIIIIILSIWIMFLVIVIMCVIIIIVIVFVSELRCEVSKYSFGLLNFVDLQESDSQSVPVDVWLGVFQQPHQLIHFVICQITLSQQSSIFFTIFFSQQSFTQKWSITCQVILQTIFYTRSKLFL